MVVRKATTTTLAKSMSFTWRPQSTFTLSCIQRGTQIWTHSQTLSSLIRTLADLLTAIAALFARRQPHSADNSAICHGGVSHPGVSQLRAWDTHASSLDPSLQAAPLLVVSATISAASTPVPFTGLLGEVLLTCTCLSRHSLWTRGPATWEARRGFSRARSGSVSKWLECA